VRATVSGTERERVLSLMLQNPRVLDLLHERTFPAHSPSVGGAAALRLKDTDLFDEDESADSDDVLAMLRPGTGFAGGRASPVLG
jgi:hypothetical protein